jgi:flagellar biosynthesis GTPase FlhF
LEENKYLIHVIALITISYSVGAAQMPAVQSTSPSAISGSSLFLAAPAEYLDFSMPSYDKNQAASKAGVEAPSFSNPFGDFDFGASKADSADTSADDSKAAEEKATSAAEAKAAKEQAAADEKAAKEAAKKQAEDEAAAKKAEKEARRKAEAEKQKAAVDRAKAQQASEAVSIILRCCCCCCIFCVCADN